MSDRLHIVTGEVIDVQLTSETLVVESAVGRRRTKRKAPKPASGGRITNRMRVFLRDHDAAKETMFDFEGAKLGVRDGHHCAVVRGHCKGAKDPVNLMLINISTNERDFFELGIFAFLNRKRFFGPIWTALGLSLIMIAFGVFFSQVILGHSESMSVLESFWWSLFFAFLVFPIFWWLAGLWQRMDDRARLRRARQALIEEVEARLRGAPRPTQAPAT